MYAFSYAFLNVKSHTRMHQTPPHLFQVKIQTFVLGSPPPIIKFWIRHCWWVLCVPDSDASTVVYVVKASDKLHVLNDFMGSFNIHGPAERKPRQLQTSHSHLMLLQQHLYNGLARPADYCIFAVKYNTQYAQLSRQTHRQTDVPLCEIPLLPLGWDVPLPFQHLFYAPKNAVHLYILAYIIASQQSDSTSHIPHTAHIHMHCTYCLFVCRFYLLLQLLYFTAIRPEAARMLVNLLIKLKQSKKQSKEDV